MCRDSFAPTRVPPCAHCSLPCCVGSNRVLRYDLVLEQWDELQPKGRQPDPCYRHASCLVREQMAVWGGYSLQARLHCLRYLRCIRCIGYTRYIRCIRYIRYE